MQWNYFLLNLTPKAIHAHHVILNGWSVDLKVLDPCWRITQQYKHLTRQSLFRHHNRHIRPASPSSVSMHPYCTSIQTHFQAASQSPRSLSPYTREQCGRDPISSSDWISGSRRGAWELLIPPFFLHSFTLYTCFYVYFLIYFFYKLLNIFHDFPHIRIYCLVLITLAPLSFLATCISNLAHSCPTYFASPITCISTFSPA